MRTNVIQATTPETITFNKKNIKRSAVEKLSVVIITYNEEKNIGRCIDSVAPVADEIIVLDSFSADATVQIARQ
ncbi:MAG TPA: glycosyltransferase, partial [Ferruginibacter sp.]|nr:glycosyltransferase [Ferruginibacter sp.]